MTYRKGSPIVGFETEMTNKSFFDAPSSWATLTALLRSLEVAALTVVSWPCASRDERSKRIKKSNKCGSVL